MITYPSAAPHAYASYMVLEAGSVTHVPKSHTEHLSVLLNRWRRVSPCKLGDDGGTVSHAKVVEATLYTAEWEEGRVKLVALPLSLDRSFRANLPSLAKNRPNPLFSMVPRTFVTTKLLPSQQQ